MRNAMIIDEKDNVIVAVETIKKGEKATYEINGAIQEIPVTEDIQMYHKIARVTMNKGEKIIKYGEYIGEAGMDIVKGCHVHVHNVLSVREKIVD